MRPEISIIIPTHTRVETLRRALASIRFQTYRNFEVLVVQNGPSRNAEPLVREFAAEGLSVAYFHILEPNGAAARNFGVTQAAGEYIAFLDDDDEWFPEKLREQKNSLDRCPEAGMVFSHPLMIYPDGRREPDRPKYAETPGLYELVRYGCVIRSFSGVMIRRSALEEAGPINTDYKIPNDWDLYLKIARRRPILMNETHLYCYYVHETNFSKAIEIGFEEMITILKKLEPCPELKVTREVIEHSIRNFYRHYYGAAVDAMDSRNYRFAALYYARALQHEPLIGLRIHWGRFRNPAYKLFRPYGVLAYCFLRSLTVQRKREAA